MYFNVTTAAEASKNEEGLFNQSTVVILINATKQFWYALQNTKWRSK